jgi:CheY-specific phosphatase CheX
MDWKVLKEATKASISEVLETMFFLPLEVSESERGRDLSQTPRDQLIGASLRFGGPIAGKVFFLIPIALARSLTADFLGQETADVGPDEMEGTVKEAVNMITGKTLSVFDEKSVFKLGIPDLMNPAELTNDFFSDNDDAFTLLFDAIEHQLALRIAIET